MWWYNILGYNKGSISHILRLDPINEGSILLTSNLVALKKENSDIILIVKITEWRKFIDYFGLSIEANLSKVSKKNTNVFCSGFIPRNSSGNPPKARHQLEQQFNLEPPQLHL